MPRLPTPGGDDGNWGTVLNEFLEVAHNTDGSPKNAALPLSGGTLSGPVEEAPPTIANISGTYNLDLDTNQHFVLTMTGDVTISVTNAPTGIQRFTVVLKQDGTGGHTTTWGFSPLWAGGSAPTVTATASAVDIYTFYFDGTNYYGFTAGQGFS